MGRIVEHYFYSRSAAIVTAVADAAPAYNNTNTACTEDAASCDESKSVPPLEFKLALAERLRLEAPLQQHKHDVNQQKQTLPQLQHQLITEAQEQQQKDVACACGVELLQQKDKSANHIPLISNTGAVAPAVGNKLPRKRRGKSKSKPAFKVTSLTMIVSRANPLPKIAAGSVTSVDASALTAGFIVPTADSLLAASVSAPTINTTNTTVTTSAATSIILENVSVAPPDSEGSVECIVQYYCTAAHCTARNKALTAVTAANTTTTTTTTTTASATATTTTATAHSRSAEEAQLCSEIVQLAELVADRRVQLLSEEGVLPQPMLTESSRCISSLSTESLISVNSISTGTTTATSETHAERALRHFQLALNALVDTRSPAELWTFWKAAADMDKRAANAVAETAGGDDTVTATATATTTTAEAAEVTQFRSVSDWYARAASTLSENKTDLSKLWLLAAKTKLAAVDVLHPHVEKASLPPPGSKADQDAVTAAAKARMVAATHYSHSAIATEAGRNAAAKLWRRAGAEMESVATQKKTPTSDAVLLKLLKYSEGEASKLAKQALAASGGLNIKIN